MRTMIQMPCFPRIRSLTLPLLTGGIMLIAQSYVAPATAQRTMGGGMNNGVQPPANFSNSSSEKPQQAPPPALPGSRTNLPSAAPMSKAALDMPPTEGLFDAINRGDAGAARDAISRGADPEAHNVLGMTPLELSVDLGRNDITFMLMSMRASESDRPEMDEPSLPVPAASSHARISPPPVATPVHARGHLNTPINGTDVPKKQIAQQALQEAAEPASPARANVPDPQSGFLGFDRH